MSASQGERLHAWLAARDGDRDAPWLVETDVLVRVLYTVDAEREETTVLRACYADRYVTRTRRSAREGVTRIDLDPPQERFSADEPTARALAAILAHNGIHGTLRRSGDDAGERF